MIYNCVAILSRYSENVLSDKDCENVYELVYSSNHHVAQAAGDFLNHKLFKRDDELPPVRSAKGKKRSANTPLIRDLVQFFIESEVSLCICLLNVVVMERWELLNVLFCTSFLIFPRFLIFQLCQGIF